MITLHTFDCEHIDGSLYRQFVQFNGALLDSRPPGAPHSQTLGEFLDELAENLDVANDNVVAGLRGTNIELERIFDDLIERRKALK